MTTWDDSDEESSDEQKKQEILNLALMPIEEESFGKLDKVNDLPTFYELYEVFKKMHYDLNKNCYEKCFS